MEGSNPRCGFEHGVLRVAQNSGGLYPTISQAYRRSFAQQNSILNTACGVETPSGESTSTASGPDATASGPDATASGPDATANGPDATASGPDATASGPDATASGSAVSASGSLVSATTCRGGLKPRCGLSMEFCAKRKTPEAIAA
ncbi:MAG: hypothetical protein LBL31_01410 [Spirochaetaceae bacterium]|nr:hypothetical protein [Spirochaetaceae bacterium]